MLLHRFPGWVCSTVRNLSRGRNIYSRILVTTKKGRDAAQTIMFRKGLPQGDAFYLRLFTVCPYAIAWKISALDKNRLSKPIDAEVTDLPYRRPKDSCDVGFETLLSDEVGEGFYEE